MDGQPTLTARGVTKRYGAITALDGVTLDVSAPATGLLGANGAGKSTLMKALLGLVRPDAGELSVLGLDVAHDAGRVRTELGYMPEGECLPQGMTARDFVVFVAELRGLPRRDAVLRASEVLFHVGLEEERSRLIRTFSTGMKQRTKLAQALVHSPRLVILDEPTNGLDPSGREEMLTLVRRLSRELEISVLLSSHVLEDVERTCDAVVLLREGKVARAGDIGTLRAGRAEELFLRVSGDAAAVAEALRRMGIEPSARGDGGFVVRGGDGALDAVRDAVAEAGAGLRELRPAGPTLEDALVEAME